LFFTGLLFANLPEVKDAATLPLQRFAVVYLLLGLFVLVVLSVFSYRLNKGILKVLVPLIRAEGEVEVMLSGAFGGKSLTAAGRWTMRRLSPRTARRRIKQVLRALIRTAAGTLDLADSSRVRANIFIAPRALSVDSDLESGQWLRIAEGLHINMDVPK